MIAELYTKPNCPYCVKAKMLLKNRNVDYKEFIISQSLNEETFDGTNSYVSVEEFREKIPHAKTVPQIWLDGSYVGGYTELSAFFDKS